LSFSFYFLILSIAFYKSEKQKSGIEEVGQRHLRVQGKGGGDLVFLMSTDVALMRPILFFLFYLPHI
jgi:hypothetical protein